MAHQKHAKLTKPTGGKWGRQEIAIMGAPCGEIKKLTEEITTVLAQAWRLVWVDADHQAGEPDSSSMLSKGAIAQLTNKISHYELTHATGHHWYFNEADLVLVNGNHFTAAQQIAWVHPKKSLEKKLAKLTDVRLIILEDEMEEVPAFLQEHLSTQPYKVIRRRDWQGILSFFKELLDSARPALNGLVLVGGRSTRMQTDKSRLSYVAGKKHYQHLADLMQPFCQQIYVSVRDEEQAQAYELPAITDKFIGLGPYGGILSAFMHNPNTAWLVLAVDLPLIDTPTLEKLTADRDIHKTATCFIDPQEEFPEPLISIWEPRAYPVMLDFLSKGYSCPRKVLINSDIHLITDRNPKALTNVNTPEEYRAITGHEL